MCERAGMYMPGCIYGGQSKLQVWVFIFIMFEMGVSKFIASFSKPAIL